MLTNEDKQRVWDEVSDLLYRHPELTIKDLIQKYRDIADFLEVGDVPKRCQKCELDGCMVEPGENVCVCCGKVNPKRFEVLSRRS